MSLHIWTAVQVLEGFPGGSDGKESACNAGDLGLIPGSGRSPEERNGNPLQYSCLENPMDRGAWRFTVHGVAKSWHDWATNTFSFFSVSWRWCCSLQLSQLKGRLPCNAPCPCKKHAICLFFSCISPAKSSLLKIPAGNWSSEGQWEWYINHQPLVEKSP